MPLSRDTIALAIRTIKLFKSVTQPDLRNAIRFQSTTERIFTWNDRNRLITRIRSALDRHLHSTGNGYTVLAKVRSSGTDRFGLSSNDRLQRARKRFLAQIRNTTDRAVLRRSAIGTVVEEVQEIIDKQSSFRALIAYEAARSENLARFEELVSKGASQITIKLSLTHRETDICNDFVGTFPADKTDLPPFHPYCRCYVVKSAV